MLRQFVSRNQKNFISTAFFSLGKIRQKHKVVMVLYPPTKNNDAHVLGSTTGALGLKPFCKERGIDLYVTHQKSGKEFDEAMKNATVLISQPFQPCYLTKQLLDNSPKLQLAITAGVGSDHVNLEEANKRRITVAEVTGSNVVSVAEHVVMQMLILMRNFVPSYKNVVDGGQDIADLASNSYDIENKVIGTIGAGRIGLRVLQRLKPFNVHLHYHDKFRLPNIIEEDLGLVYHETIDTMLPKLDILTINCPLHKKTEGLLDYSKLKNIKKGAYIVNTARGKIVVAEDLVKAVNENHIRGYAGDVQFPQPAPKDHIQRTMKNHAMTPHVSGTTLDAQMRYAKGTEEILQRFLDGEKQRKEFLIAENGSIVSSSYEDGDTTSGATNI